MKNKKNWKFKTTFAVVVLAITTMFVFLVCKKLEEPIRVYRELKTSFIALEKEHKRLLSGRNIRLWKTPTCDFFKNPDLNELCRAIAEVDERKFEELVERDLDLNEIGKGGMTVLFFAYMEGEYPGYIRLLAKGAKPDVPLTEKLEVLPLRIPVEVGETVMFAACRNPDDRRRFMLPALKHADNINLQDSRGHTVLHQLTALRGPTAESILFTIKDSGIDPMIKDKAGKTAREYAVGLAPQTLPIFDAMIEKANTKVDEAVSSERGANGLR